MQHRQIVLDTETTGLDPAQGHRVIEIGCVELIDRRLTGNNYHVYLNPEREVDAGAVQVHGLSNEFLADKPRFTDVVADYLDYVRGAELVIHNAPFDVGFLDHEMQLAGLAERTATVSTVLDSLTLARDMHPGQKNSLDALCKRYEIDNSQRDLHGALLDALLLAEVYLAMTGGQTSLLLQEETGSDESEGVTAVRRVQGEQSIPIIRASADELAAHEKLLERVRKSNDGRCLFDPAATAEDV